MENALEEIRREDTLFGHILVQHGFTTRERVHEALTTQERQTKSGHTPRLGEILLQQGHITFENLQKAITLWNTATILRCDSCRYECVMETHDPAKSYLCPAHRDGGTCRQPMTVKRSSGLHPTHASSTTHRPDLNNLPPDAAQAALNPKQVLGKYILLEALGRGGMGVVYKAFDTALRRHVALKQLIMPSAEDLKRFLREARTAAKLRHPNIAAVFEIDCIEGHHVIAMELIHGEQIHRKKMTIRIALGVIRDIARAIDYAHRQGIVHRDLKPQNILIDTEGKPHLLDFGIARAMRASDTVTAAGYVTGTPSYMSPEQARGKPGTVDHRCDIYGLGATMYHLLTGRPPFDALTQVDTLRKVTEEEVVPPRTHNPAIPREVELICLKAMDKDPSRRYGSGKDMAADIDRHMRGAPVQARAASQLTKMVRRARRVRKIAIAVAITTVLMAAGAVALLMTQKKHEAEAQQNLKQQIQPLLDQGMKNLDETVRNLYRRGADLSKNRSLLLEAVRDFTKAVQIAPASHEAFHARGRAYHMLGEFAKAEADFTRAVQILPEYVAALRSRALLNLERSVDWLFKRGWTGSLAAQDPYRQKAADDFRRISGKMPDELDALFVEAHRAYSEQRMDDALAHGNTLLARVGTKEEVVKLRGDIHHWKFLHGELPEAEKAEEDYGRAIDLRVNYTAAYKMRGALRYMQGNATGAESDFQEALKIHPDDPTILMSLGILAARQKKWAEAETFLTKAIEAGEDAVFVFNTRGVVYQELKKPESALRDYTLALERYPDHAGTLRNRGLCYYTMKNYPAALADLERAVHLAPALGRSRL